MIVVNNFVDRFVRYYLISMIVGSALFGTGLLLLGLIVMGSLLRGIL